MNCRYIIILIIFFTCKSFGQTICIAQSSPERKVVTLRQYDSDTGWKDKNIDVNAKYFSFIAPFCDVNKLAFPGKKYYEWISLDEEYCWYGSSYSKEDDRFILDRYKKDVLQRSYYFKDANIIIGKDLSQRYVVVDNTNPETDSDSNISQYSFIDKCGDVTCIRIPDSICIFEQIGFLYNDERPRGAGIRDKKELHVLFYCNATDTI